MMEEEWAQLKGYPDYFVSSHGRVFSERSYTFLNVGTSGYSKINIYTREGTVQLLVHRLVAECFVPGMDHGLEVNHIDGDKANNDCSNLEWVTSRENNLHALQTGLRVPSGQKRVCIVETGESFQSIAACARHIGGTLKGVSSVLRGDKGSHRGLTFTYLE